MIARDLSNFLITVDLNPILTTIPSIIFSTRIQSPTLNLYSTNTKIPEIKFLNKSCAPSATATPTKPNPAIIGPTFIHHKSNTAAAPKIIMSIFKALKIQFISSLVKIFSSPPIR